MTRIKICGIQTAEAAEAAIAEGAHALGLMFYAASKRYITPAEAGEWALAAPPLVGWVGVFVNPSVGEVHQALKRLPLTALQFHGDEPPEFCAQFARPYIKALRIGGQSAEELRALDQHYASAAALLLDTHVKDQYGGSGQCFDWQRANFGGQRPIILAGGLNPGNVAIAIQTAHPYAVDVSSGVETGGSKDPAKLRQFCANVLKCEGG